MAALLGKPLVLVNADAVAAAEQSRAAAGGRPRRLRLRRRGARRHEATPSSPATRCAPRSRRCPRRRSALPAAAARCACWWSAAAWARACSTNACRGAWRCGRRPSARRSPTRPARRTSPPCRPAMPRAGVQAELLPFIDDMAQRLAECDLVVCRAGAVTVSELCAAGVASVLVPLVVSTTEPPARQRRAHGGAGRGDAPAAVRAGAAARWPTCCAA